MNSTTNIVNKLLEESISEINEVKNVNEDKLVELSEAMATSMVSRSREAKINAAVGAIAVKIALQKNDPYAKKMLKFRKLWKQYKDELVKKYGPIAYQKYMQNQAKK